MAFGTALSITQQLRQLRNIGRKTNLDELSMSSYRQIEANRRNALKSTGPKASIVTLGRPAALRARKTQLRGVLVMIGGADALADGAAGDSANVTHKFQPSGRALLSNSP
jgi:hypothetical protein